MGTARRGRAPAAVMASSDLGAAWAGRLGGCKQSPAGAGGTGSLELWHRRDP
jgi:hypothetical protein